MCAATIKTSTDVAPWFSYQASETDYEEWDQSALENVWSRLHRAVPEFGSGIEVIETANPRTYYEQTRRKLGMVLGVESMQDEPLSLPFANLFIVGDTVSDGRVASIVSSSMRLADQLALK
jgi:phytoene dehydrogenase-like protein